MNYENSQTPMFRSRDCHVVVNKVFLINVPMCIKKTVEEVRCAMTVASSEHIWQVTPNDVAKVTQTHNMLWLLVASGDVYKKICVCFGGRKFRMRNPFSWASLQDIALSKFKVVDVSVNWRQWKLDRSSILFWSEMVVSRLCLQMILFEHIGHRGCFSNSFQVGHSFWFGASWLWAGHACKWPIVPMPFWHVFLHFWFGVCWPVVSRHVCKQPRECGFFLAHFDRRVPGFFRRWVFLLPGVVTTCFVWR